MKKIFKSKVKSKKAKTFIIYHLSFLALCLCVSVVSLSAQSTEITYQGQLQISSAPASGNFDFDFLLFDAAVGGPQIGSTLTRNGVAVANGGFSVNLDFGSSFPGASRFLEIHVRQSGGGAFTMLTPRQSVTSAPYSVKSLAADSATNATNAVTATNFTGNLTGDVTGTQSATVVTTVGGQSAANVGGAAQSVTAATSNNTPNTLVRRDASGNFIAGIITGTLTGNASTATNAVNATNATTATNATQLGGVAANQYVVTTDPRMTDARNPLPTSANYIWNQDSVVQTSSNFGISGNGFIGGTLSAGTLSGNGLLLTNLNAANIASGVLGTARGGTGGGTTGAAGNYLRSNGTNWTSSALQAADLPTGSGNYIQNRASPQAASNFNVSGNGTAGGTLSSNIVNATTQYNIGGNRVLSVAGTNNVFAGVDAGGANTSGFDNSFFGRFAGDSNTTGNSNSFFGRSAGFNNTTGDFNSFFGASAGQTNTTGIANSFFGRNAGVSNTTGFENSFFGTNAGFFNTTGIANSFFGRNAGVSNTTGGDNSFFGRSAGEGNTTGTQNSFFGGSAGLSNTTGGDNSFFGRGAGFANTTGFDNSFFGRSAGNSNTTGNNNTIIGDNADVGSGNRTFATAIGAGAIVSTDNTVVLGRTDDTVRIPGFLQVVRLGLGGFLSLCRNAPDEIISNCSSSLRYKENINTSNAGLDLVKLLRPVSFNWKNGGMLDMGLVAEEVAAIEPLLVTYNSKGEVEGVKYDRIGVVLVNAVKEQQAEISELRAVSSEQARKIEDQSSKIKVQQKQIDALTRLVCASNKDADICKEQ